MVAVLHLGAEPIEQGVHWMNLWCKRCLTLKEHRVIRTYTGDTTRGRRITTVDRIMLDPHDGITPLVVHGTCECGRAGRFICNSDSVTAN